MINSKVYSSTNSKVYTFCADPMSFVQVIEKLDELAVEQHTSRSRVIADILYNYCGVSYEDHRRAMDIFGTGKQGVKN